MQETNLPQYPGQLYRIDKFKVPASARAEFLQKVRLTHAVLQTQPGFIQDLVLEQTDGPGEFNFVTVAVWKNAEAMGAARQAVIAKHAEIGFKPAELFDRLGIQADVANYAQLEA